MPLPRSQWLLRLAAIIIGLLGSGLARSGHATVRSPDPDALSECQRTFELHPTDYDAARCFYTRRHEIGIDAAQKIVDELRLAHPTHANLLTVAAHFGWNSEGTTALDLYTAAAELAATESDDLARVFALASRRRLLAARGRERESSRTLEQLRAIGATTHEPQAEGFAQIEIAAHELIVVRDVAAVYEQLREVERRAQPSWSASILDKLYAQLGRAAVILNRIEEARTYSQRRAELAAARGDDRAAVAAAYAQANLAFVRLVATPSPQLHGQLVNELEAVRVRAQGLRYPAVEAQALALLGLVSARETEPSVTEIAQLQRCLDITAARLPEYAGTCHVAMSQQLRHHDPILARKHAAAAITYGSRSTSNWRKAAAWQAAMRRTWEWRPVDEAVVTARLAVDAIELLRAGQADAAARRDVYASWTLDHHWLAARLLSHSRHDAGVLDVAFEVLERTRARVLHEQLERNPATAQQTREEQRTIDAHLRELSEMQVRLLDDGLTGDARAEQIRQLRATTSRFSEDDSPTSTSFATLAQIQAALRKDEAMVIYLVNSSQSHDGEDLGGSWALLATHDGAEAVALADDRSRANESVRIYRGLVERRDGSERRVADQLRQRWIRPVLARLPTTTRSLVVLPDGPLHAVPFGDLARSEETGSVQITYAPSATVWLHWRGRRRVDRSASALALVDPSLGGLPTTDEERLALRGRSRTPMRRLDPLPHARREGTAIVRHLDDSSVVLTGDLATERALRDHWKSDLGLLHLGAHAVVDAPDPDHFAILLARDGSDDDGYLQIEEIEQLPLDDAVVVLSGCATAAGTALPGEGLLSLARGFHTAGASTVVASLWPVRDDESAQLFEEFYRQLGTGASVSTALESAKLALRRAGAPTLAHAGFIVLGNGDARLEARDRSMSALTWWWAFAGLIAPLFAGLVVRSRAHRKCRGLRHEGIEFPRR